MGDAIERRSGKSIVQRIAEEAGIPDLPEILAERVTSSDLGSLLLHVFQRRAAAATTAGLLAQLDRAPLVAPSSVDARLLNELDRVAFAEAREFEALELSPVCPLGLNRVLGRIDQNNVLSALRGAEVTADPTSAQALECARRRRQLSARGDPSVVRLCASHRAIRLQPTDVPGFSPHFRLFAMTTAGRDTGEDRFETTHLSEHIDFYLRLMRALSGSGFTFGDAVVEISDADAVRVLIETAGLPLDEVREVVRAHRPGASERLLAKRGVVLPSAVVDPATELRAWEGRPVLRRCLTRLVRVKERVFDPLGARFPGVAFRFDLSRLEGLSYYAGLSLRVSPVTADGQRIPLIDGGFTDWTARLLNNRKERLLISGMGSEFACRRFRR